MKGRGRRATFPACSKPGINGGTNQATLLLGSDSRCFQVQVYDGDHHLVDLRSWGHVAFTHSIAPIVHEMIRQMGPAPIRRTLYCKLLDLRRFWRFLDTMLTKIRGVEDMTSDLINSYEDWLEQNTPSQMSVRRIISPLIQSLRLAVEMGVDGFPVELEQRLTWLARGEFIPSRPRDAYSPREATVLRKAARQQIKEAKARILLGDEMPEPRADIAVRPRLLGFYSDVIDAVGIRGAIQVRSREYRLLKCGLQSNRLPKLSSETLHGALYLTRDDLLGFLILLSLETGIEIECLKSLTVDCLHNPSRGYVEIEYCKRRARGGEWKHLRVRDGGSKTPGALIRLAVKLTARARRQLDTTALWAWWGRSKLKIGRPSPNAPMAFVKRHGLVGDDGQPLHLELSRLRKTHKAERYLRTQGQLDDFAVGHSVSVAAQHYADIPALRYVHEDAIADALHDALGAAFMPTVVVPTMEATMRADPDSSKLPVKLENVSALLDGESDVWLASCGGFFESPFASFGEPCPTPFWGCLECKNAVITARKLPALIAFDNFMIDQRAGMEMVAWVAKFGRAHHRITEQIIPAFPSEVVADARVASAEAGSSLFYLPPEVQTS